MDIGKNLGGFFTAHETLQESIREDQKSAKTSAKTSAKSDKKPKSLDQQALDRVLAQRRIAQMEVELRETLIYHAPPELGAVYTDFIAMREVLLQEREQARADQELAERRREWKRQQQMYQLQDAAIYASAVLFVIAYMALLAYALVLDRQSRWGY